MKRILIIISLLISTICILSCNNNKVEEVTLGGMLYYRDDALTFVPCDEKDVIVNIIDETNSIASIYKDTMQYYYIGEAVYAELKGELLKPEFKLVSDEVTVYTFTVKQVIQIKKLLDMPADCKYCDYSGGGENPSGWTFEVSEVDECITMRDDADKKSYYFDYVEPIAEGDTLIYTTQNVPMQSKIEIKINCLLQVGELSSEKEFPVELIINDKRFYGFAKRCY